jgi:parallel beta-helix repeat protein
MHRALIILVVVTILLLPLFSIVRFNFVLGSRTIVVPVDFSTIQEAINNATDGDQVFVLNGTYRENVVVNKTIGLVGEGRDITIIDGGGNGFGVNVISNNSSISGFTVQNSSVALIHVLNVNVFSLTDSAFARGSIGVDLFNANSSYLSGNVVSGTHVGIRVESCNGCTFENNNVSDNQDMGVLVTVSKNIVVSSNVLDGNVNEGLYLNNSVGNAVTNNSVADNGVGMRLDLSGSNSVFLNNVTGSKEEGIIVFSSSNNVLSGNVVKHNGFGVKLSYSGNNTLRGNDIASNEYNFGVEAVALASFLNDVDVSNTVNGKHIYYLVNRKDLILDSSSSAGYVAFVNSTNVIMRDLSLTSNNEGILTAYTKGFVMENCTIADNRIGIYVYDSSNATVQGNMIAGNAVEGVSMYECDNINMNDNVVTKNGVGMILYSIANSSVTGNNVSNNTGRGIQMQSPSYNMVSENLVENNGLDGMYILHSNYSNVGDNQVIGNARDGLWVDTSQNTTLSRNNVTLNGDNGIYLLVCTSCLVQYNKVLNNSAVGLQLSVNSNNNTLVGNVVSGNVVYGISLYSCSNNQIFNNNFVNRYQVQIVFSPNNSWDGGYSKGGNFWSDYSGKDVYWGAYQNLTGSDGIGDTPYVVDSNNVDRYPLMKQFRVHDVAVVAAAVNFSEPYVGWPVDVNFTVRNAGDFVESFNVTVYCGSNVARVFGVSNLFVGDSTVLVFTLDTNGLTPCHNYTVKCQADTIAEETNTADNTRVAGVVHVRMMGDIDGNGKINIVDVASVAVAFLAKKGDAKYRLTCDLNRDGVINILDITLVAQSFGKSCSS